LQSATTSKEYEAKRRGRKVAEEDAGSHNGGEEELSIVDGIVWIQVGKYLGFLTRNVRRRWSYPPFHICIQEEMTVDIEVIRVEARVGEERRETMTEEEEATAIFL
jgi:hypothetical protein